MTLVHGRDSSDILVPLLLAADGSILRNETVITRPLGVYTATYNAQLLNRNARGLAAYLNITAAPGVETLTLSIYDVLPDFSGLAATLLVGAALATPGLRTYIVYPEVVGAGVYTQAAQFPISRDWFLQVVHSGAGSWTYSLGYHLFL